MENKNQVVSQEKGLLQSLAVAIRGNEMDVSLVDKLGLNIQLRKYKNENGSINYPALFDIPRDKRITAMAERNLSETIQYISVALTLAAESMNLVRPMTSSQIIDLAEIIVDEAKGDNLSFEDLMLFLQKLTRGEYQENYEGMDIPKFMARFNKYRDERWGEAVKIREEKELYYKTIGQMERTSQPDSIAEHMTDFAGRIGELKDRLRDKSEEVKFLRGE